MRAAWRCAGGTRCPWRSVARPRASRRWAARCRAARCWAARAACGCSRCGRARRGGAAHVRQHELAHGPCGVSGREVDLEQPAGALEVAAHCLEVGEVRRLGGRARRLRDTVDAVREQPRAVVARAGGRAAHAPPSEVIAHRRRPAARISRPHDEPRARQSLCELTPQERPRLVAYAACAGRAPATASSLAPLSSRAAAL